jgi:hypothetical protein
MSWVLGQSANHFGTIFDVWQKIKTDIFRFGAVA